MERERERGAVCAQKTSHTLYMDITQATPLTYRGEELDHAKASVTHLSHRFSLWSRRFQEEIETQRKDESEEEEEEEENSLVNDEEHQV